MAARKRKRSGLPRGVERHRNRFRAWVSVGGRLVRESYATLEEAVAARSRMQAAKSAEPAHHVTLSQLIAMVEADNVARGLRPATLTYWSTRFGYIAAAFHDGTVHVRSITEAGVRRFLDARAERLSSTTLAKDYSALSKLFRFALARGFIIQSPLAKIRKPAENDRRLDFFTPQEFAAIVAKVRASGVRAADRHADLFELLYWTGLRRSEAARLTAADVDLVGRILYVEGKTKPRRLPIVDELVPVLERMLPKLVGSPAYIDITFRRWAERLDLCGRFRAHAMRHSFASAMVAKGVPLATVAVLLGHKGTELVARYYHSTSAELRDALGALRA